ncbi:hypothetical protein MFLAVUS_000824 [Mucor flavus]|uniref:Uncharacterized protein n=1 Tax=Mucor flavus TaxID=439312 RepID=A0ABP9YKS8_9FUNG
MMYSKILVEKETSKLVYLYFVALEYFNGDISIKVKQATLKTLLDDLSYFGQNVKTLKLRPYKHTSTGESKKFYWKNILRLCPNIISIRFLKNRYISLFLVDLQYSDLMLNDLKNIETEEFGPDSLDIQDLCLQVNIQYRETITSLQLCALKEEPTAIKYNGLVKLISQFPRLTCLKTDKVSEKNPLLRVDIKHLFEENPQLNDVELDSCAIFASSWKGTNTVQSMEHISLISLKITADTITTDVFQYLTTLLKRVKSLHLSVGEITADEAVLEEEFVAILCNLIACTSEMERVNIKYSYNGEDFNYNKGDNDDSSGDYSYYYGYPYDYEYDDSDYDEDGDDYEYTDITMGYRDCIDKSCNYCSD